MRSALLAVVVIAILAAGVRADPPKPAATGPQPYRSLIIGGDIAGALFTFGFGALAYRSRNCDCEDFSGEGVLFGLGAYVAIGPSAHWSARHYLRAVASATLRIGLPLAAGELAYHEGASPAESLWFAGGGMVAAMMIDWFALSEWTYDPGPENVGLYVAPATGGGAIAGLRGPL